MPRSLWAELAVTEGGHEVVPRASLRATWMEEHLGKDVSYGLCYSSAEIDTNAEWKIGPHQNEDAIMQKSSNKLHIRQVIILSRSER